MPKHKTEVGWQSLPGNGVSFKLMKHTTWTISIAINRSGRHCIFPKEKDVYGWQLSISEHHKH